MPPMYFQIFAQKTRYESRNSVNMCLSSWTIFKFLDSCFKDKFYGDWDGRPKGIISGIVKLYNYKGILPLFSFLHYSSYWMHTIFTKCLQKLLWLPRSELLLMQQFVPGPQRHAQNEEGWGKGRYKSTWSFSLKMQQNSYKY